MLSNDQNNCNNQVFWWEDPETNGVTETAEMKFFSHLNYENICLKFRKQLAVVF